MNVFSFYIYSVKLWNLLNYVNMYSGNKNIKNTILIKWYFATYVALSSSVKIKQNICKDKIKVNKNRHC